MCLGLADFAAARDLHQVKASLTKCTQLCAVSYDKPFFAVVDREWPVQEGKRSYVCASYQYKCLKAIGRCTKGDVAKGTFKYVYNVYDEEECQSLKRYPEYKDVKCCKSTDYNPCNRPDPKKDPIGRIGFPGDLTLCNNATALG